MKAVYSIRPGDNEELRYSLRSLEVNMPFIDEVIVIGQPPKWLSTDVEVIDFVHRGENKVMTRKGLDKFLIVKKSLGDFIYMNDDFFAMRKMSDLPSLDRGRLEDVIGSLSPGSYRKSAEKTMTILEKFGTERPYKSYELHMPMMLNTEGLNEVFYWTDTLAPSFYQVQFRTVYGNFYLAGDESNSVDDCKNVDLLSCGDFYSSSDHLFDQSGIKEIFKTPSKYEI